MTAERHFDASREQRRKMKQEFARQCFEFRRKFLVSQVKFADLLGVCRRALQYYEAGEELASMRTRARFRELQKEFAKKEKQAA